MTTRERWYALHRARRVFLREQNEHLFALMTYGSTVQCISENSPGSEYLRRALDMLVNPPMIVDPLLVVEDFRPQPRRLP